MADRNLSEAQIANLVEFFLTNGTPEDYDSFAPPIPIHDQESQEIGEHSSDNQWTHMGTIYKVSIVSVQDAMVMPAWSRQMVRAPGSFLRFVNLDEDGSLIQGVGMVVSHSMTMNDYEGIVCQFLIASGPCEVEFYIGGVPENTPELGKMTEMRMLLQLNRNGSYSGSFSFRDVMKDAPDSTGTP